MLRTAARGYDRRAVDEVLQRCVASLGGRAAGFPELRGLPPPVAHVPSLDARDVRDVRFPVVRRGYDIAQVDDLLARVAAALPDEDARPSWDEQVPTPPQGEATLALRRTLRGYDVTEVDEFLTRCAHSLGTRVERVPELGPLLSRPRTGTPLRARDVEVVQFRVRAWGYDIEAVDRLLDQVADALEG